MDISIRRIFQLCAALVVVAVIYRAGNAGLDTPATGESALWDTLHTLIAPLARVYLSMFNSPATAILLSGGLVLAGILLVLWFVFLKVGPALSDAGKAEPVKPAPVKGGAGKNGASKAELAKVEAAKIEAAQPRSQRIDLRFDMVVPGTERPGQAGGLILRPTAK